MKSLPLAHTSWLQPFFAYFLERGVELAPYLAAARIEEALVVNGDGWISKHQLYSFLNELAAGEDLPELGFVVGERLTPHTLGAIGEQILCSETLGEAIGRFCRLVPRHVEDNRLWVEEGERGEVWFFNEIVDRLPESDIADHAGVMSLVNIVRLAAGSDWYPRRITLQAAPTEAHRRLAGLRDCDVTFGAHATGVAFPGDLLLSRLAANGMDSATTTVSDGLLGGEETFSDKLRHLLSGIVGVGGMLPSVHLAAEIANTSPRTLHRRLREEEISYQGLVDEARYERATYLLANSDASVKELAFELGYSGPNNFVRAFRRISGVTPGQFRQRLAG